MKGWKHKKTPIIVGNEKTPTKMEAGQVIINKKATKQNLNKLIDINNDGLNSPKEKITTDGTDGGLLKGKPHYDKNGNSLGGIPVVVDGGKRIEVEGDEFVVNKEASQKHWKELSKINQSAGNGVAINPQDVGYDEDPQEYKEGGAIIEFNPNDLPNKWIYSYAKNIKEKYPKVWGLGGNIFGNEAFKNLERVIKRGYWTDNEEWMYIKWRSFVARHKKDYRIAGVIAMLKWVDKVEKGWPYMKDLIEKEIAKKYPSGWKHKKAKGGPVTYRNKYNKKYGYDKNESHNLDEIAKDTGVSKKGLQKIFNKGVGAYNTNPQSVRPTVKSEEQWGMGRVYSAVMGGKAARIDANELKMEYGGGIKDIRCKCGWGWNKNQSDKSDLYICHKCGNDNEMNYSGELKKGIKTEQEHKDTLEKIASGEISVNQAIKMTAKDHLKENPKYYTELAKIEKMTNGGSTTTIENGDIVRGDYFPKIYGNFLVLNAGADALSVRNLLTEEESIKTYNEVTLFIKKGGAKVDVKPTTQTIQVQKKEGEIKAPMPTKTPIKEQLAERKKYDLVDFKPLLENWVNSNFNNSILLTKKDIVKETITNYILDVEAVDGNQTIQFNKESEILDNIDNYLN
jgi:hypothetical protein